jgi:hypothetical protein
MYNFNLRLFFVYGILLLFISCTESRPQYIVFSVGNTLVSYDALGLMTSEGIDTIFISTSPSYAHQKHEIRKINRMLGASHLTINCCLDSLVLRNTSYQTMSVQSSHSEIISFLLNSGRVEEPQKALKIALPYYFEYLGNLSTQEHLSKTYSTYRLNKLSSLMQNIDSKMNWHDEIFRIRDKDTTYWINRFSYGIAVKNQSVLLHTLEKMSNTKLTENSNYYAFYYVDMSSIPRYNAIDNSHFIDTGYNLNYLFFKFEISCDKNKQWLVTRTILNPTGIL